MSKYEAYWLTDFPLMGVHQKEIIVIFFFFEAVSFSYTKSKQTSVRKMVNFIVNRDHTVVTYKR